MLYDLVAHRILFASGHRMLISRFRCVHPIPSEGDRHSYATHELLAACVNIAMHALIHTERGGDATHGWYSRPAWIAR